MAVYSGDALAETIERRLACPRCHGPLQVVDTEIRCRGERCSFRGALIDGVVAVEDTAAVSFFDDKHQVMQHGNEDETVWQMCYERQARIAAEHFRPGAVVLDVGCGPSLPYANPQDCFVIGLEASYHSIRANNEVDLRVYGTAAALPLPAQSVDLILCFYSIHHMVGRTIKENRAIVAGVLREFARVAKPGGALLVAEVTPWPLFGVAEQGVWNLARRVLRSKLDMYFWPARSLAAQARRAFPHATFRRRRFSTAPFSTFPPAFSLPWLRVPRLLYPFDVTLYEWHF